ncbi:MAG: hypothetical protein SVY15_04710 [Halobacteriota archaeon]|nr:hypothetical protein [Halobacteriota archaeon]
MVNETIVVVQTESVVPWYIQFVGIFLAAFLAFIFGIVINSIGNRKALQSYEYFVLTKIDQLVNLENDIERINEIKKFWDELRGDLRFSRTKSSRDVQDVLMKTLNKEENSNEVEKIRNRIKELKSSKKTISKLRFFFL